MHLRGRRKSDYKSASKREKEREKDKSRVRRAIAKI